MAAPKVFSLFKTINENGVETVRDFSEMFPNIITMDKKIDFFLECISYDVLIPSVIRGEKRLDIFEEAVLKLINAKSLTHEEMADVLCLTIDLVNFIVIRLIEMNLLERNGLKLTDDGRKLLNLDSTVENQVEYVQGKLFVIKKTGEVLPYIHTGEFKSERVTDYSQNNITVEFGSIGSARVVYGKCLRNTNGEKVNSMLQTSKIRAALKRFNLIANNNLSYEKIDYDEEWAISSTLSDNVYVHMQAVIQKGNVDEILVSDGLVENVDFVNKYITRNFPNFKEFVQEKNAQTNINESDVEVIKRNKNPKYKEIDRLWNKVERDYDELEQIEKISENATEDNIDSEDDQYNEMTESKPVILGDSINSQDIIRKQRFKQKALLLNAYACYEWIFFTYLRNNPLSDKTYNLITMQGATKNRKIIKELLEQLGISAHKKLDPLFGSVDKPRIVRMIRSNNPEFRCALGLMILSVLGNQTSRVKILLRDNRDYLKGLYSMFSEHGDLSHQSFIPEYDMYRIRAVYRDLRKTIEILIPDFNISIDDVQFEEVVVDTISQERLDSIVHLSKELGSMYFNNIMTKDLRNEWIQIAPNLSELPDVIDYVEIMYRIMQDTLYQKNIYIKKSGRLHFDDVLQQLALKGVKSKCFDSVNEHFFDDSMKNINSSLGANAIVFLHYQDDDIIKKLVELDMIVLIEKLVSLRKHGGNVGLKADVNEMNGLRQQLINVVRYIGGM